MDRCSTKHRVVSLMSACVIADSNGMVLIERGTCRGCGHLVERRTPLKSSGDWRRAHGPPATDGIAYACVPPGRRSA